MKERFRPYIERLLLEVWEGDVVLTLGTEAFKWFAPYGEPAAAALLWKDENRYERGELSCVITSGRASRRLTVCPLPHPSPLNQRWVGAFPGLLAARLSKFLSP